MDTVVDLGAIHLYNKEHRYYEGDLSRLSFPNNER